MQTKRAIDKIYLAIPIIKALRGKLKNNKEFIDILTDARQDGKDDFDLLLEIFPFMYENCIDEIYNLLAIVYDKSIEVVQEQPIMDTIKDLKLLWNNADFRRFF